MIFSTIKRIVTYILGFCVIFSIVLAIFCTITSIIYNEPVPNRFANILRFVLGSEFVTEIEEFAALTLDLSKRVVNIDDVEINKDVEKFIRNKDSIQIDNFNEEHSLLVFLHPEVIWDYANFSKTLEHKLFKGIEKAVKQLHSEKLDYSLIRKPNNIPILIKKPYKPKEGEWEVFYSIDDKDILFKTFIRPDQKRHWAIVDLCYINVKNIKLNLVFGSKYEDKNGKKGSGDIKENDFDDLLACFNGGFMPIHDKGGFIIDGKELIPLKENKATLIVYENNEIEICEYTKEKKKKLKYKNIRIARQNQPPLMINGSINKTVKKWGFVLKDHDPVYAYRSALGITKDNMLIYAVGKDISAQTLAFALRLAGCVNAMHLDMNPSNLTFSLYKKISTKKYKNIPLSKRCWKSLGNNYIKGYSHDFFYITKR